MYKKLGYFERRKILKQANFLDLHPIAHHGHELEEEGTVRVLIPRFKGKILSKLMQSSKRSPFIKLSLDELGSATWLLMDGNNDVRTMCRILREQKGEKIEPAQERVTRFLSQLFQQNLIIFREIIKEQ
jgi:hypothetical protein